MEDILEPLERYRSTFAGEIAKRAEAYFDDLTRRSAVDIEANRATIARIGRIRKERDHARRRKNLLLAAIVVGSIVAIVAFVAFFSEPPPTLEASCLLGLSLVAIAFMIRPFKRYLREMTEADLLLRKEEEKAWEQMKPLNDLYPWGIETRLFSEALPLIAFDSYFSRGRLAELREDFGWDDSFNENKSIVFTHSGEIKGNPFVLFQCRSMEWGEVTYRGSRTVSWTTTERGGDGKLRTVRHSETLVGEVTRPAPVFEQRKLLLYANDAAPNLSFTRAPSTLSSAGTGIIDSWRKKRAINSLRKFSSNLEDDSNYTLMANHEFEALFETRDRSDEVEYRMLFTPLAQQQMLLLLKDKKTGYGDDFSFTKVGKINLIQATHLDEANLDPSPAVFHDNDYDAARQNFLARTRAFFKGIYFAFAPFLAIPLYQQTKTHREIYKGLYKAPSFWEYERLVNAIGDKAFQHPDCITENILKADAVTEDEDPVIEVTANGFRGIARTEVVQVRCRNGRYYNVTVPWTEFHPVTRTSKVRLSDISA